MRQSRITLAVLAVACVLTSCNGDSSTTSNSALVATKDAEATTSVASNASAPAALQFSAPSVGGGAIDFTQFAGRPVALWFWAPT